MSPKAEERSVMNRLAKLRHEEAEKRCHTTDGPVKRAKKITPIKQILNRKEKIGLPTHV